MIIMEIPSPVPFIPLHSEWWELSNLNHVFTIELPWMVAEIALPCVITKEVAHNPAGTLLSKEALPKDNDPGEGAQFLVGDCDSPCI